MVARLSACAGPAPAAGTASAASQTVRGPCARGAWSNVEFPEHLVKGVMSVCGSADDAERCAGAKSLRRYSRALPASGRMLAERGRRERCRHWRIWSPPCPRPAPADGRTCPRCWRAAAHGTSSPNSASHSRAAARLQRRAQARHELVGVLRALAHAVVALVGRQFVRPVLLAQRLPEMRRVGRQVEMPSRAGWMPVTPPERMSRPMSSGSPSAQIRRADCIVSALRSSDTPTYWPRPLRSRSNSAEDTPEATSAAA
jgi:hypothetical protein